MRKPGSRNKDAKEFLAQLKDRNFDMVDEYLKLFKRNKRVIARFFSKLEKAYTDAEAKGEPTPRLETILTEGELDFFKEVRGENINILTRMAGFCYPKLKAMTVASNLSDQIVFQINIGDAPAKQLKSAGQSTAPRLSSGAIHVGQKALSSAVSEEADE